MTNHSLTHHSLPALGRLRVYVEALRLAALLHRLALQGTLGAQARRAAQSVVLDIAEGDGQASRLARTRHFRIARASLWEVAAALDLASLEGTHGGHCVRLVRDVDAMLHALLRR